MKRVLKLLTRLFFLAVVLSLSGCAPIRCDDASGDECLRVLFVGNSYTYVNNLPNTFSELARSGGHQVEVGMIAEGGLTFADHAKSSQLSSALTSSQWDYVILQEQSQIPSVEYSRTHFMYPSARALVKQIRAHNATPIFFETWAHRNGYPENGMPDYESMQYETSQGYLRIARELNVPLARVGFAWFRALKMYPDLELWQEDGNHPSEQGTYLAACIFYVTLFHESPVGLEYRGNLSEEVAGQLQEAANSVLVNP
ncbi:MAG: hypothetical protein HYZ22_06105 [Chloroflexi bacterium]|nr:hypothetical protein [Chloroflexota bacterium]